MRITALPRENQFISDEQLFLRKIFFDYVVDTNRFNISYKFELKLTIYNHDMTVLREKA